MMMMKHNISRSNGGVGERLFTTSRALSPSDDETTTQTSTTSYSANTFPFGRPSSLSAPPPTAALFPTTTRTNTMTMTAIGARLDAAVAAAKPVNRSADLVPLTQDYYKMKKQLKSLANAARVYHLSMLKMNEARREVDQQFSTICANSPIHEKIVGGDDAAYPSFLSVNQAASDQFQIDAVLYHQMIIQYLEEWKLIVTSRVDVGLKETRKLQETLFHYQSKVSKLRYRVTLTEDRHAAPTKLSEKLDRNNQKHYQAWKDHECAASKVCCLIEEVTMRGWKDLYPVLQSAMDWQAQRANAESNSVPSLVTLQEQFASLYHEKIQLAPEEEPMQVVVAVAAAASQAASFAASGVITERDSNDYDEEGLEAVHISCDDEETDDDLVVVSNKAGKDHGIDDMNDDDIVVVSNGNRRLRDFFKILRKQATPLHIGEAYTTDDDDVQHGKHDDKVNWGDETVSPAMSSMFQNTKDNVEDGAAVGDTETSFVQCKWESFMSTDDNVFVDGKELEEPGEPIAESSPFDEGLVQDQDDQYSKAVAAIVQRRWDAKFALATSGTSDDQDETTKPTDSAVSDNDEIAMEESTTRPTPKKQNLASPPDKEKGWDDPLLSSWPTLDEKIRVEGTGPAKYEPAVDDAKFLTHNHHLPAIETSTTVDTAEDQERLENGENPDTPSSVISI